MSKSFSTLFRRFSRRAKNVKNRQKASKQFFRHFSIIFAPHPFFWPLLQIPDIPGIAQKVCAEKRVCVQFLAPLYMQHMHMYIVIYYGHNSQAVGPNIPMSKSSMLGTLQRATRVSIVIPNAPRKRNPQLSVGVFHVSQVFFFLIFADFLPWFFIISLCFLTFLTLENGRRRTAGYRLHTRIYIWSKFFFPL